MIPRAFTVVLSLLLLGLIQVSLAKEDGSITMLDAGDMSRPQRRQKQQRRRGLRVHDTSVENGIYCPCDCEGTPDKTPLWFGQHEPYYDETAPQGHFEDCDDESLESLSNSGSNSGSSDSGDDCSLYRYSWHCVPNDDAMDLADDEGADIWCDDECVGEER